MKFNEKMLLLYAVTDRSRAKRISLCKQVEAALRGGVTMVQLREKNISDEEYIRLALQIKELCRSRNVPLIINDNAYVALKSGADGVHVGADDMPVTEVRKIVPADFIVGATAKTVSQAQSAERGGADYLGVGAVFASPTKSNAIRITKEQLCLIASSVNIPIAAIGGITYDNADELSGSGIKGIAVVSALFEHDNIELAANRLREKSVTVIS